MHALAYPLALFDLSTEVWTMCRSAGFGQARPGLDRARTGDRLTADVLVAGIADVGG